MLTEEARLSYAIFSAWLMWTAYDGKIMKLSIISSKWMWRIWNDVYVPFAVQNNLGALQIIFTFEYNQISYWANFNEFWNMYTFL